MRRALRDETAWTSTVVECAAEDLVALEAAVEDFIRLGRRFGGGKDAVRQRGRGDGGRRLMALLRRPQRQRDDETRGQARRDAQPSTPGGRVARHAAMRAVRGHPVVRRVPFILLTGRGDKELVVKAAQAGANNYLIKPFTTAILRSKIEQVMGKLS